MLSLTRHGTGVAADALSVVDNEAEIHRQSEVRFYRIEDIWASSTFVLRAKSRKL